MIAVTTKATFIGGDGEAEELIAIADEGSATAAHFVGVQLKPNPNKRSVYRVKESLGLHSHFHEDTAPFYLHDNSVVDGVDDSSNGQQSRFRRNSDDAEKKRDGEKVEVENPESLPTAAAQTSEAGYYRRARSRLSDLDSMSQPNGDQPGLRRVPRVNFVTQPRSLSPDELPEHRDLKGSPASMDPLYRRPYDPYLSMPPAHYNRDVGRGRFFDNYAPSAYDRYDPMMMRDYGRQQQQYDPYYGRYTNNNQMYNYYQPGYYPYRRGYDYQRGGYMNDVNYMGHPTANRRVIYYANLPEVVRNGGQYGENRGYYQGMRGGGGGGGGYGDMGYMDDPYYEGGSGGYNRYMDDYNYRYNRDMNQYGMPPMPQPPPSVIYANRDRDRDNRIPDRDSNKDSKNKDTDSKTQTVSSNIRIQDPSNKGYRNGNNNGGGSNHNQAPTSDFTQPHYRME